MGKFEYNKSKPGRILLGRGPRDLQLKQKLLAEKELQNIKPSIEASSTEEIDLSQFLPLDEVKIKLEEAVKSAKEEERKRYESGLKNLNEQLNAARKKAALAEEKLINANSEIARLNEIIKSLENSSGKNVDLLQKELTETKTRLDDANKEIINLKNKLEKEQLEVKEAKNKIIELQTKLNESSNADTLIQKLQDQLDKLYAKISDGSISPLVGSKIPRPELETRIFIDPLDESARRKEEELDAHIEVEEQKAVKRSVEEDISKLRKLLKL